MKKLIGKRVLTRTYNSGVSIGILKEIETENSCVSFRLKNGVRIWKWENAFTVSEIATKGATCRIAKHPKNFYVFETNGVEVLPVADEAWKFIQANWIEGSE